MRLIGRIARVVGSWGVGAGEEGVAERGRKVVVWVVIVVVGIVVVVVVGGGGGIELVGSGSGWRWVFGSRLGVVGWKVAWMGFGFETGSQSLYWR